MDLQTEASDGPKSVAEVCGGVCEEELAKQLQAVAIGNQECGDLAQNLKDSHRNDIECTLDSQTMGSGESKCETPGAMENISNGVSEEEATRAGSPLMVNTNKVFSVIADAQEQEAEQGACDEERNYEVAELVNQVLNDAPCLEECSMNGLSENGPRELNDSEGDNAVTSSSHVLYENNREENRSSPDSDSNMATASEGSTTPTSELSAASSSSDQQTYLNIHETKSLSELICSTHLVDTDNQVEELSSGCNSEVIVDVDISKCTNNIDVQEVQECVISSGDSVLSSTESVNNIIEPIKPIENGSLEVVDSINLVPELNSHCSFYEKVSEASELCKDVLPIDHILKEEIEIISGNVPENGLLLEKAPEQEDFKKVQITPAVSDIQTFVEKENVEAPAVVEPSSEIVETEKMNGETSNELQVECFLSNDGENKDEHLTDSVEEAGNKLRELDTSTSKISQEEERCLVQPDITSDATSSKFMSVMHQEEEIKQDEGFDEVVEKTDSEAFSCDLEEESEQSSLERITRTLEEDFDKSDIQQVVAALETLSLTADPEKEVERTDSQLIENTIDIEEDEILNDGCDEKVECYEDKLQSMPDTTENSMCQSGDATGCSSTKSKEENSPEYDCTCKRSETTEESGNLMVEVWAELRSSLRQLHRSMIPQSSQLLNQRSRPSINRIKALANMLVSHDAHQLYLRISHLAHEFCIELKVRLLATIHDNPTPTEATAFIQGICDSYQSVMNVCEALHPALENLDTEHLSRFKLNWVTVNMHVFHSTIITDPDVLEYAQNCKEKLKETPGGDDVLNCLASLHRTLAVAEAVWVRADTLLQEYAIERAALSARRRQLLADWEQFKAQQRTQQQQEVTKSGVPTSVSSTTLNEEGGAQCPCDECVGSQNDQKEGPSSSGNTHSALSTTDIRSGSSCECHFCNASVPRPTSEEPVLPPSSGSSLPPLAQPQLSLYPHIHNTPPGSDIVGSGQSREELGPVPPAPTTKPPITTNPYLGSDLLTEQLMREWELVYGDALTPPGSHPILPPPDGILQRYEGDPSSLVSGVETMRISSSRPSYTRAMVDPSMPYVPDSCATARAHTTILPSSQSSASPVNPATSTPSVDKVPVSISSSTLSCEDNIPTTTADGASDSDKSCCATSNVTSVITHTRAHQTQTTAAAQKGESETCAENEWNSGEVGEPSSTVSSTHQESHCDCCYCHMLHHKQGDGRQKYNERRERLLKILSLKKSAHNNATCQNAAANPPATSVGVEVPSSKGEGTPIGGQNIEKIMDFIEGNQTDEAKRSRKVTKKARQKQKKKEEKEEEKRKIETPSHQCEDEEEVEDGPLAELRRRAPDVTITVVRPGQQTSRTPPPPQMAFQRPRDPSPPAMEVYKPPPAKLVPSLVQPSGEAALPQSSSRTILHPSRHSVYGRQPQPTAPQGKQFPPAPLPVAANESIAERPAAGKGESGGLSNILKAMDTTGKEKDKGSQMVTIRRVMDPNSAEPTVTITLKGEQPEKDKVLFKLVNGQAVAGNGGSGQNGKKGSKKNSWSEAKTVEPAVPEGLDPEELKKLKKKQKKERQKQKKQQDNMQEQEVGHLQQLEIRKQQEFLRQQQEQIHQQQLALQRQQEELMKQQQKQKQQQQTQNNGKGSKKKNKASKNAANESNGVSAVVYDGDNMAPAFNLPPGVTINKVAGQPGMVTISNNMGGAFSQPFLPNPNIYPSPVVQGFPMSVAKNSKLPDSYSKGNTSGLSWNSAIDKSVNYPDKDNVIVVDTNKSFLASKSKPKKKQAEPKKQEPVKQAKSKPKKKRSEPKETRPVTPEPELTSEEKIELALKGEIDPSTLTTTQKKKYKKRKKILDEEEEEERRQQQEEDELMDKMYNIAMGNWTRETKNQPQGKKQNKKNQNQKENSKQAPQTNNNNKNSQQASKSNKQQTKQESQQQKQKQNKNAEQNNKNNGKGNKDNTLKNITNQPKKEASSNGKTKNKKQSHQEVKVETNQQKQGQKKMQQQQKQTQNQKQNHQQEQKTQQKQKQHEQEKQHQKGKQKHSQENSHKVDMNNYSKRHGYDPQDIAHEARYAQYLAANANTLAKMTYNTYNGGVKVDQKEDEHPVTKKKKKKGKKGNLEDMMIDSVFTPKDVAEGELDETERDVEAFKRFCFNNVPLHSGAKPKVNFNVKDIMIKKRPCNGNL